MKSIDKLSKEEFLKFLNCSPPPQKITYTLRNKETTLIKSRGTHTACNVSLEETALDNKVIRIPLPKTDLKGLSKREVKLLFNYSSKRKQSSRQQVSSFGRKLKKKRRFEHKEPRKLTKDKIFEDTKHRKINTNNIKNTVTSPPVRSKRIQDLKSKKSSTNNNKIDALPDRSKHLKESQKKKVIDKTSNGMFSKMTTRFSQNNQTIKKDYSRTSQQQNKGITYYLNFASMKYPEEGRLNYPFEKLVRDIKDVILPGPLWKIKVIVRSNKITSIVFTNKCDIERSVTFSTNSKFYYIVIDNKPALLLGAPPGVSCIKDIEVLLDIVHSISPKNLMVFYK